jgi:hypothetical protein
MTVRLVSEGPGANVTPSTVSRGTARTPYGATELTPYSAPGVGYYYIGEDQKVAYATPKSVAYLTPIKARETLEAEKRGDIKPLTPQDRSTLTYISNYNVGNWQMTPEEFKGTKTLTRQVSVSVQQPTIAPDLSAIDLAPKKLEAEIALRQNKIGNIFLTGYEGYKNIKNVDTGLKVIQTTIQNKIDTALGFSIKAQEQKVYDVFGGKINTGIIAGLTVYAPPIGIGWGIVSAGEVYLNKKVNQKIKSELEFTQTEQQPAITEATKQSMREVLSTGEVSGYRKELFNVNKITTPEGNINYSLVPNQEAFNKYFKGQPFTEETTVIGALAGFKYYHPYVYAGATLGTEILVAGGLAKGITYGASLVEKIPTIKTPWGEIRGATTLEIKSINPISQVKLIEKYPAPIADVFKGTSPGELSQLKLSRFWGLKQETFIGRAATSFRESAGNINLATTMDIYNMKAQPILKLDIGTGELVTNKIGGFSTLKGGYELNINQVKGINKQGDMILEQLKKQQFLITRNIKPIYEMQYNIAEGKIIKSVPDTFGVTTNLRSTFNYKPYSNLKYGISSIAQPVPFKNYPTQIEYSSIFDLTGKATTGKAQTIYKVLTLPKAQLDMFKSNVYFESEAWAKFNIFEGKTKPFSDLGGGMYLIKRVPPPGGAGLTDTGFAWTKMPYNPTPSEISAGEGLSYWDIPLTPKETTQVLQDIVPVKSTTQLPKGLVTALKEQTANINKVILQEQLPNYLLPTTKTSLSPLVMIGGMGGLHIPTTQQKLSFDVPTIETGLKLKTNVVTTKMAYATLTGLKISPMIGQKLFNVPVQSQKITQVQTQVQAQKLAEMLLLKSPKLKIPTPGLGIPVGIPVPPFIPFIFPPFLSPSAEAVGARKVKARRITKYTPSYGALVFNIKGKPARKTALGYTGLELRKIPAGFNYGKTFKRIIKRKVKRRK